jgi:hypothetical protein
MYQALDEKLNQLAMSYLKIDAFRTYMRRMDDMFGEARQEAMRGVSIRKQPGSTEVPLRETPEAVAKRKKWRNTDQQAWKAQLEDNFSREGVDIPDDVDTSIDFTPDVEDVL